MNKAMKFTGLVAIAALAVLLYTLRHTDSAESIPAAATTGMAPAAEVAAAIAPVRPTAGSAEASATPVSGIPVPTSDNTIPAVPALASGEERDATRAARQEAMPAFLQAAEATLVQLRADIKKLKADGAPLAEIQAAEARLQQLTAVREQVLARNADIAPHR